MYKDGSIVTDFTDASVGLNEIHGLFTNGQTMSIGGGVGGTVTPKKLAFIDILEGVSADPTSFAFDNAGTWTRKRYTGSYGTYGFKLDGSDTFNDVSGNAQHFTGQNMDASNLDAADLPPYTN